MVMVVLWLLIILIFNINSPYSMNKDYFIINSYIYNCLFFMILNNNLIIPFLKINYFNIYIMNMNK